MYQTGESFSRRGCWTKMLKCSHLVWIIDRWKYNMQEKKYSWDTPNILLHIHEKKRNPKKLSVPFVFDSIHRYVCVVCPCTSESIRFFFSLASIPPSLCLSAGLLVLKMEYFSYSDRSRDSPIFFYFLFYYFPFCIVAYFHISLFDVTKTYLGVVMKPVSTAAA